MNDYPVWVGSMLFTLVDPHEGAEVEYNRWYERDHYYTGCMVGPHLLAGSRWVATRPLKDLRLGDGRAIASPLDAGSYLAIYWVEKDHHDDHFGWGLKQVQWIYENGRGFDRRTHAHTSLYNSPWMSYRDDDPVPIELALDHRYAGLGVVAIDLDDANGDDAFQEWLGSTGLVGLMTDSPVASVVSWKPSNPDDSENDDVTDGAPMDLGTGPGTSRRRLQLFFCETDPTECWDAFGAYAAAVDSSGHGKVRFAAPFIPTVVGTDKYADQLW